QCADPTTRHRQAVRREVSAHALRPPGQQSYCCALPGSFGKEPLRQRSRRKLHGGMVVVFIPSRVFALAQPTEIVTVVVKVIYSTNFFWEKKIECPIKCYTNLFV